MDANEDPRNRLGHFLVTAILMGAKAARFSVSAGYRARVRQHWLSHPQYRLRNIGMMVFGVALDVTLLFLIGLIVVHGNR